jgi:hypothetical protein
MLQCAADREAAWGAAAEADGVPRLTLASLLQTK